MGFWHVVRVVKRRKWVILGIVAVTIMVIAIAAPKPRIVYEASAYVSPTAQVMQGGATTANRQDTRGPGPDRAVILSNLIILAQQGEVYDRARSFLEQDPKVQTAQIREFVGPDLPDSDLPQVPPAPITKIELEPGHPLTIQEWSEVMDVAPVQNMSVGEKGTTTDIIRITVRMHNGDVAPYLANAVAIAFAKTYQDKSRADTRTYAAFIRSSRSEAKAKLDELRNKIAQYKRANNVMAVDAEAQSAIGSIANLEATKSAADSAIREAQAALNDVDAQLGVQPLVVRQALPADMNPEVKTLRDQLAQAETDLRLLGQRYKPAHDAYKAGEARIAVLKERIAKAGATFDSPIVNDIHLDLAKKRSEALYALATAKARSASMAASIAAAQAKIDKLAQAQPELTELMTEYSQAENTYKTLSEKYDQALIAEQEFTETGSIVPYGWAHVLGQPVQIGPSRKILLVFGFVLSLAFAVALSIWLDSIDNRMRNAADVEKLLELPVIGLTPQLTGADGSLPRLTHLYPLSPMAESYRILRTNVLFALRDNPFKTLMVATGRPGQGATTTICNLAIALAQAGKRIILIDADMRRPSLHRFFDVPNDAGLSTLLQGEGVLTDAFQKTGIDNLIVIPAGPQPLNPSELLGSERMHGLVDRLEEHCDLVLFDTPSTVVFSDGPMLASWIDAVVMVVSANQVPRGTEAQTRDLLRRAKANVIGVVVNRMASDNVDSCHFYSSYYAGDSPTLNGSSGRGSGTKPGSRPKAISASAATVAKTEVAVEQHEEAGQEVDENPFPE